MERPEEGWRDWLVERGQIGELEEAVVSG